MGHSNRYWQSYPLISESLRKYNQSPEGRMQRLRQSLNPDFRARMSKHFTHLADLAAIGANILRLQNAKYDHGIAIELGRLCTSEKELEKSIERSIQRHRRKTM
jgi:hypothetical protein